MNRLLLITLAIFTLQFVSCKKDEDSNASINYTVTEYRNSQLFRKYVYSPVQYSSNKLIHYYSFNYNGSIADSVQFFYSGNRLDSLYTFTYPSGEKYLTKYEYEYDQMISIDKWYSHNSNIKFFLNYENYDLMSHINYSSTSQPNNGQLVVSRNGNLETHRNQYVGSVFNENWESNTFYYNQTYNVLSPFWVMDPISFSLSRNLVTKHYQTTRSTNDSVNDPNAQWYIKNNNWDIDYTFSSDGNMLTKTVLDTNQTIVDFYEYEYLQN